MRNKRISDQILILQSITCVRDELILCDKTDPRIVDDVMGRLTMLYACINPEQIAKQLKRVDKRNKHGK